MKTPFAIFHYQLYLLQLEEYDVIRYIQTIRRIGLFPRQNLRKPIAWSQKLILLSLLSFTLQTLSSFVILYATYLHKNSFFAAFFLFFLITCLFMYISFLFHSLSMILLYPLDFFIKYILVGLAKRKIKALKNLKIIGIAGSYGKTTMKEVLATILRQKYNVVKTPKSYNTSISIAQIILHDLNPNTDIFIVEMGEYYKGDISAICNITQPDIGIITGINEAHAERLKTLDTTIATIFELGQHTKKEGIVMLNFDDISVKTHYNDYLDHKQTLQYQTKPTPHIGIAFNDVIFHQDGSGYSFNLSFLNGKTTFYCKVAILGEYIFGDLIAGIQIAQKLGLTEKQIVLGVNSIRPVPHRLQSILELQKRILVIDDSYNGNPDGVECAIKTLSKFNKWRKIYLSPGLVEMGDKSNTIHYNIGKQLVKVADLVILIRNSVTPAISNGLKQNGFPEQNIMWFQTAQEAHENLKNIVRSGDVILFQNDWADNYL